MLACHASDEGSTPSGSAIELATQSWCVLYTLVSTRTVNESLYLSWVNDLLASSIKKLSIAVVFVLSLGLNPRGVVPLSSIDRAGTIAQVPPKRLTQRREGKLFKPNILL